MKRGFLCVLLLLMLPFAGCQKAEVSLLEPVTFYYRSADVRFDTDKGILVTEKREASGLKNDPLQLLQQYFSGPRSQEASQTFPNGTGVISLSMEGSQAQILVTSHLANLNGMNLTIACACITMTVMELTGAESVQIKAERALLNDAESIVMDANSLLFLDDGAIAPPN